MSEERRGFVLFCFCICLFDYLFICFLFCYVKNEIDVVNSED